MRTITPNIVLLVLLSLVLPVIAAAQGQPPAEAKAYFDQAEAALKADQFEKAVQLYTKAVEAYPEYGNAYLRRGVAQQEAENMNEAYQDYTKAIDVNPKDHVAWYHRGALFFALQEDDAAISDYTKAIELKPDYAEAWNNRGLVKMVKKEFTDGCKDIKQAAKYGLAKAEENIKQFCSGEDSVNAARYEESERLTNEGLNLLNGKQLDAALAKLDEALSFNPYNASAHYIKGLTFVQKQQTDSAEAHFESAIKYNPKHGGAMYNLGIIYYQRKQYQEALDMYDKAINIKFDFVEAIHNRGLAKYALGDKAGCCEDLKRASELGLPMAAQNYEKVCGGE